MQNNIYDNGCVTLYKILLLFFDLIICVHNSKITKNDFFLLVYNLQNN